MVLVVLQFGLHFRIHVYCLECAMRTLRVGYLFSCILCVRDVVFLFTSQSGQNMNHYMFCILIHKCRLSLFYLVVFCRGVCCISC